MVVGGQVVASARVAADPATYPAVMDLTRGEAGRHPGTGHHLPADHHPATGT